MNGSEIGPEARLSDEREREAEEKIVAEQNKLDAILYALRVIKKALLGNAENWAINPIDQRSNPYSQSDLMNKLGLFSITHRKHFPQIYDFFEKRGLCKMEYGTNPYKRSQKPAHYVFYPAKLNAEIDSLLKGLEETHKNLSPEKKHAAKTFTRARPPEITSPKQAGNPLRGSLTEQEEKEAWRAQHGMYAEDRPYETEGKEAQKQKFERRKTAITEVLRSSGGKLTLKELWSRVRVTKLFPSEASLTGFLDTLVHRQIVATEKSELNKPGARRKKILYFLPDDKTT